MQQWDAKLVFPEGDLPAERRGHGMHLYLGKIFIFGGYSFKKVATSGWHILNDDVHCFDPRLVKWTTCEFPSDKSFPSIDAFNFGKRTDSELYIMGGVKANERVQSTNAAAGSTGLNTDVYKLNLQDMTCEIVVTTNPCPSPRTWASSAQVGSKVYLFGGRTYNLPELRYFNDIIVFDIESLTWHSVAEPKGTLPPPRAASSAVSIGSKIYFFGGRCEDKYPRNTRHYNDVYEFDTLTETWSFVKTKVSGLSARAGAASVLLPGNRWLIQGGYIYEQLPQYFDDVGILDLDTMVWQPLQFVPSKESIRPIARNGSMKSFGSLGALSSMFLDDKTGIDLSLAAHRIIQVYDRYFMFGGEGTAFMSSQNKPSSIHAYFNHVIALLPPNDFFKTPLARSISRLLTMPDLSDLVVTWNAKPQHAHFAILMARCPTLLANLNSKDTKISHDMFRQFLSYVYEDHLVSTVLRDIESALQMLALATKFGVHSLAAECLEILDTMVDSRQNNDLVELIHAAWKQNLSELTNFGIWTLRGRGLFKHRRASNRDLITDQFVDLADELATAGVVPKTISELALVERNMATTLNTDMRRLFSLHCKISQDPTSEKAIAHDMGIWEAMVSLSLRITDFEIRLADKCFRGSKAILAARSPYFEAMISSGMREHESGRVDLDPDMSWECLVTILEYLYTGDVPSTLGIGVYMEVLCRAPFFGLTEQFQLKSSNGATQYDHADLINGCVRNILAQATTENCVQIFVEAQESELSELQDAVFGFILAHWTEVVEPLRGGSDPEIAQLVVLFEEKKFENDVESEYQFL